MDLLGSYTDHAWRFASSMALRCSNGRTRVPQPLQTRYNRRRSAADFERAATNSISPVHLVKACPGISACGVTSMIKILVVDDHAVVRAGVQYFIADIPDMQIAGEAATAEEAIRLIRAQEWDIVLLDIAMPDKSGVEVLKQIKREKPHLPVLILSMHPENRYAVQILRSGASGYVQKEALATELVTAIQTIMRGHKYISYAVAELLTMDPDTDTDKPLHETLSAREYEIFYKLSQGDGVTKIADELCLSVKTVSTYRARVLQKMNMTSNADIIYYAIKQNLID